MMYLIILTSFVINLLIYPFWISYLKHHNDVMADKTYGPDHSAKTGTPIMGGLIFVLISGILFIIYAVLNKRLDSLSLALVFSMFGFAGLGFYDDYQKINSGNGRGLFANVKLIIQIILSAITALLIYFSDFSKADHSIFGLFKSNSVSILGFLIFFILTLFWVVGFSNATNITDGLDGLLTGSAITSYLAFVLLIEALPNSNSYRLVEVFDLLIVGGLFAFLIFNKPIAKIFMGDTGSLALGAGLAVNSIILNMPWILLFFGFIYVVETISSMLQVFYYRLTKKRLFPMAPIHHTFETIGWTEWKIDIVFWSINIFAILIGFYLLDLFNLVEVIN